MANKHAEGYWKGYCQAKNEAKDEEKHLLAALEAIKRNLEGVLPGTKAFAALLHAKAAVTRAKGGG